LCLSLTICVILIRQNKRAVLSFKRQLFIYLTENTSVLLAAVFMFSSVTANLKCPAVDGVKCPKIDERAGQVTPS